MTYDPKRPWTADVWDGLDVLPAERIADDNGDELEHGQPDFPGQFPADETHSYDWYDGFATAQRERRAAARDLSFDEERLADAIHAKVCGPFTTIDPQKCVGGRERDVRVAAAVIAEYSGPRIEFDGDYPRLPGEKDTRPQADGKAINVRAAQPRPHVENEREGVTAMTTMTAQTIDAAWKEAEAALPDGWSLSLTSYPPGEWDCHATAWNFHGGVSKGAVDGFGETPAEALTTLAAHLRSNR